MRKKLIGAIAAVLGGVGAASAQVPYYPQGSPYTNPAVPAMIPGPDGQPVPQLAPGMGMIPPGADPSQMLPPGGQPMYPPAGPYGQTMYESPYPVPNGAAAGGYGGGPGPAPAPRFWFKGEYLLMFLKSQPSHTVLATTGTPNIGASDNGVLDQGSTILLSGQENFRFNPASGFRLEAGFWGSEDQRLGFLLSSFYIPPASEKFIGESAANGTPLLGRPFLNLNPNSPTINGTAGGPDNAIVSAPGFAVGNLTTTAVTRFFSIDPSVLVNLYRGEPGERSFSLNLLVGYKFMELQESLEIRSNSTLIAGATFNNVAIAAGSTVTVRDFFNTRNHYNAGQVGLEGTTSLGRWVFSASGKAGFGVVSQRILIEGSTSDGGTNNFIGGVYANSTNIGVFHFDHFSISADTNATVGYRLTPRLTGTIGYNFVYLGNVARPGNAFTQFIDPTTAPGVPNGTAVLPVQATPFDIRRDDFWMHGINCGFNLTF